MPTCIKNQNAAVSVGRGKQDQHEPVIAAFRAFAAAAGELPQPGAALGWAGP